jgi:hypothetical protein
VAQHHDVHAGEQEALDSQLTELHQCKVTLGTERATTIEFTKVEARARDVTATINHEGTSRPTFARASSNVATSMVLLDTLPVPSTSRVNKVYHQPRDILSVAAEQQVESSLMWWAKVSVLSLGYSRDSRQKTTLKHPVVGTASSTARALSHL